MACAGSRDPGPGPASRGRGAAGRAGRAGAAGLLGLLGACAGLLGCDGPIGPIPGGRLSGTVAQEPVSDWSFSDAHPEIALETRPGDPHSVTVWCVAHGGHLYVPSRNPEQKAWVRYVQADPRVRVRIGERVYRGRAARVTDREEIEGVVPRLLAKYDLDPPSEAERREFWLFRVDPR